MPISQRREHHDGRYHYIASCPGRAAAGPPGRAWTLCSSGASTPTKPRFSCSACRRKLSLASLPGPLLKLRLGSCEACVALLRLPQRKPSRRCDPVGAGRAGARANHSLLSTPLTNRRNIDRSENKMRMVGPILLIPQRISWRVALETASGAARGKVDAAGKMPRLVMPTAKIPS